MSPPNDFHVFSGNGEPIAKRGVAPPEFERLPTLDDPARYDAEPGLRNAVNVAIQLGQPLLVTGEPGTGKTQLGAAIAHELGQPGALECHTKTTSSARDLFYRYDALGHFHAAQFRKDNPPDVEEFIEYEALGLAILLAQDPTEAKDDLPKKYHDVGPVRSVVLIDEIDKAPRDLPNDVLNEIEHMTFTVKETGKTFTADPRYKPIVVLTSNSERTLPDAFLRRCVFYHITFPKGQRLRDIVNSRVNPDSVFAPHIVENAIKRFEEIRKIAQLKKPPATAELLGWVRVLGNLKIDVDNLKPGQAETLAFTCSVLAKTTDDLKLVRDKIVGNGQQST